MFNICSILIMDQQPPLKPADDMAPLIIIDCGNFTLDFKHLVFSTSLLFLQSLGT